MRKISAYLYFTIVISISVVFVFLTFIVWLITYPMGDKKNAHFTNMATRIWFPIVYYIGWFWGWRIKIEGKENVPDGACIFMSNHQAIFDIPIFFCLAKDMRWVSKKEILRVPLLGEVLLMRGDVRIDRKSSASAKHMLEACKKNLDEGISMIIYPEGTRTKTGDVGPFKAGGFLLAKQCEYPIVPSVIVGDFECVHNMKMNYGNKFILKFLPAISKEEIVNTDVKKMMAKVREEIVTNYEELRHIN